MTESDNPPSEARPLETEPLVIERLESVFEPPLPKRPGDRWRWARLYGCGKGLAIAAAARRHRGPCLVIVPNAAEAGRIADEVQFFGDDSLEPLAFPDWETLPYDRFSPYQDIVSERLATLYRLPELPGGSARECLVDRAARRGASLDRRPLGSSLRSSRAPASGSADVAYILGKRTMI